MAMTTTDVAHSKQTAPPTMEHSHTGSQAMAALAAAGPAAPTSGIRALIRRHPVAAYVRAGVRALLARALRWRVGPRWYALALLGFPAAMFLLATSFLGAAPLRALADKWPLVFAEFLPQVLLAVV